jgi:histone H3/H4
MYTPNDTDLPIRERSYFMTELPRAPVERILKKAGAERVSVEAVDALCELMEAYAAFIAHEAIKNATHSDRKTVRDIDIRMAAELFK